MKAISLVLTVLILSATAFGQVDEARQAIDRGEYVRAVGILSDALADRPSADVYLYLGIAYRHIKEYPKAQDIFAEGGRRYPNDARFHIELANLFIENNDIDAAKTQLRRALAIDPENSYASDRLATIDMSEGEVQAALRSWNKSDRPNINDILHNYNLNFGSWVVRRGLDFYPSRTLRYDEWKTSELRLLATDNFSNVGLELEPTIVPEQYNAVVRTTTRRNTPADFVFNLLKATPVQTSYLDVWNIRNSGINFNSNYRWDPNRRRINGGLKIPIPLAGLLHLETGDTWRNERWNLSDQIRPEFLPVARFDYKANAMRIRVKQIPQYRIELGAGFEYRNRALTGEIPQLATNSLNTGKFSAEVALRLADGTYKNRLRVEGFAARPGIIGNIRFTGGAAELNNRITLSRDSRTYFDWSLKGGAARGELPIDEYFVLAIDSTSNDRLRAHISWHDGSYGHAPMGTDFVLINTDIERRLRTIPLFNALNIPFITVKWELFFDAGKTWDRNHILQPSKLLLDTGAVLRLETPTHAFNLVYGRSLRDGQNAWYGYYERRLW